MKKIGVVTGTRAEYGLLKPILEKIRDDKELELSLIVTGMHLEERFGYTYKEIENDGFIINYKNKMNLDSDTSAAVTTSMGIELMGFADIFADAKLDMLVVLGDRYEILVAAVAAMMFRIPIAHIHGGELTKGLIDDAIRHSITKMSMLHFASTDVYAKRIIQMGEQPQRVFSVGSLGIENMKSLHLLDREELANKYGNLFEKKYILVTYHPVTLEKNSAKWQFQNILNVLDNYKEYNFIFTYANADPDGQIINEMIEGYIKENLNTKAFVSMGQLGYLSAMRYCEAVLGNSSSGIIETPFFHKPTINIGERQEGRMKAETVIDCGYSYDEIKSAFEKATSEAFKKECELFSNPYEKENTSSCIISEIKKYVSLKSDISKEFYDIEVEY